MKPSRFPPYPKRPHASGQARITFPGGECVYLGPFGSVESREKYNRTIAEFALRGGRPRPPRKEDLAGLVARYLEHAAQYYRKRGEPTTMVRGARSILGELVAMFGSSAVATFDQFALKTLRASWIDRGLSVRTVNEYVGHVRRFFAWAADEGLLPPEVTAKVRAVRLLKAGRCAARVTGPIGPVDPTAVAAVLPHVAPSVAAMIQVQALTGMRPIEVCWMRPTDLDRSGDVWKYVVPPEANKETHARRPRTVAIGPKAQAIMAPFLGRAVAGKAVFRCIRNPSATWPGYVPSGYTRAIWRGCDKAGIPRWSPNRLRHLAATQIRAALGSIEGAQEVLGHTDRETTAIYAEKNFEKAAEVARRMG